MEKQIIVGVLTVLLLFLLLAFVGAIVVDRDYTYSNNDRNVVVYDENDGYQDESSSSRNSAVYDDYNSDSYRNVNVVVYDENDGYIDDDNYNKNNYYYVDSKKATDDSYGKDDYRNNEDDYNRNKKNVYYYDEDYDYAKKDSSKCYEPLDQIKEKRCYRPLLQVRGSCDKGSSGCFEEGYYGRYYGSNYNMNYDDNDNYYCY